MKPKLSKKEVHEKIDEFFRQNELKKEEVRKIKRIAMKHKIKLGKYRRRFCRKCYSDLKTGKIRTNKTHKVIECSGCGEKNRFKIF